MIENIHIFGATTITGEYLKENIQSIFPKLNVFTYSRNNLNTNYLDLKDKNSKILKSKEEHIIINISPIWLLSDFLENLILNNKDIKIKLKGIITCSSSSVITKRFSINKYDKNLVKKLKNSEEKILRICSLQNINYSIVRPTLIYGSSRNYSDKNLKYIIRLMSLIPLIVLPSNCGLRQPIHAKQLSRALLKILINMCQNQKYESEIITLGGDQELNYKDMIKKIIEKLPSNHSAKKTIILEIPNRLFYFLFSPLLLIKPKLYEAILRIGSDLAGFKKSFQFSNTDYEDFPILPYTKNNNN